MATRASRVALESAVRRIVGAAYDTLLDADALDAVDDVFLDDLLRKVHGMEMFLEDAKARRLQPAVPIVRGTALEPTGFTEDGCPIFRRADVVNGAQALATGPTVSVLDGRKAHS